MSCPPSRRDASLYKSVLTAAWLEVKLQAENVALVVCRLTPPPCPMGRVSNTRTISGEGWQGSSIHSNRATAGRSSKPFTYNLAESRLGGRS